MSAAARFMQNGSLSSRFSQGLVLAIPVCFVAVDADESKLPLAMNREIVKNLEDIVYGRKSKHRI